MSVLKIYNSLTNKKEIFKPILPGKVRIYVCGPTVYDFCHIGNGRTFVIFDIIVRYLRYCGYRVQYVRNITDIDDKIINRAKKNNESIYHLTNRMIKEMHFDLKSLNVLPPDNEPHATHFINQIIKFIERLIRKKHAYISYNGDVLFSVESYPKYGSLSNQKLKNLRYKEKNYKFNVKKNNSTDFVLWKRSKLNDPGWESPWGYGRPGWHIECSTMNKEILGSKFDIHGGGSDLIFPHHENEISQSVCAYRDSHVNFWIHSGMVLVHKKKISKSIKNTTFIRDIISLYGSDVLRYFFMSSHYRSNLNYNKNNIEQAKLSLNSLYLTLFDIDTSNTYNYDNYFIEKFRSAMNDDFNTPKVYSIMFEIVNEINFLKNKNIEKTKCIALTLKKISEVLGLLDTNTNSFLKRKLKIDDYKKVNKLIFERDCARKLKNWEKADNIRNQLVKMGIKVEDHSDKTTWKIY